VRALTEARELGFLGPGPLEPQLTHAHGFAAAWDGPPPARAADLGSGGGLPGLVLAACWPTAWWLIEAAQQRGRFLQGSVEELGFGVQVTVVRARAEEVGRWPDLRGTMDLVTARSFGPPAVTAECAAPLLRRGGLLIVSEPPGGADERWPVEPLRELGLAPQRVVTGEASYMVLEQVAACPERYPRRTGMPRKRPLYG